MLANDEMVVRVKVVEVSCQDQDWKTRAGTWCINGAPLFLLSIPLSELPGNGGAKPNQAGRSTCINLI